MATVADKSGNRPTNAPALDAEKPSKLDLIIANTAS